MTYVCVKTSKGVAQGIVGMGMGIASMLRKAVTFRGEKNKTKLPRCYLG